MKAIDTQAQTVLATGGSVHSVYFCTDDVESSVVSEKYLTEKYPRYDELSFKE
jgi:hypothetical protein